MDKGSIDKTVKENHVQLVLRPNDDHPYDPRGCNDCYQELRRFFSGNNYAFKSSETGCLEDKGNRTEIFTQDGHLIILELSGCINEINAAKRKLLPGTYNLRQVCVSLDIDSPVRDRLYEILKDHIK